CVPPAPVGRWGWGASVRCAVRWSSACCWDSRGRPQASLPPWQLLHCSPPCASCCIRRSRVVRCGLGQSRYQQNEETMMERRKFLTGATAAIAAAALPLKARADELPLGPLPGTRYPDPRVEVLDPRFKYRIGNAAIERIATGFRWAEGPVYVRDGGYLLWSDIPNNRIMRWSEDDAHLSVFLYPSNYSNGNTRDREGRLITCEHDTRRVTRTEHDGTITVLMDSFNGKKLNAPNDVVVSADGVVWFTDPGF